LISLKSCGKRSATVHSTSMREAPTSHPHSSHHWVQSHVGHPHSTSHCHHVVHTTSAASHTAHIASHRIAHHPASIEAAVVVSHADITLEGSIIAIVVTSPWTREIAVVLTVRACVRIVPSPIEAAASSASESLVICLIVIL